jgi:hypothetical protein
MNTKYLAPICAGLVGLTGVGFMSKALIKNHVAYSDKTFPEVEQILKIQNERYAWNYELDETRHTSPRQILEDKHYSALLEKINTSELQEMELLKNPEMKTKYEVYKKSQLSMSEEAWKDAGLGLLLFAHGMFGLAYLLTRGKK